jgi:hypothetical protein
VTSIKKYGAIALFNDFEKTRSNLSSKFVYLLRHAISDDSRAWKFTGVDQGVQNPVKMEIFQNISAERCFQ